MKIMAFVLIASLLLIGTGSIHAQDTLIQGELERTYTLHLPDAFETRTEIPALIALHPSASSGLAMELLTGLDEIADEHGFMVVYPDSQGLVWAEDTAEEDAADDVTFLADLIDELVEEHHADRDTIYLAGMGNGGLMTFRAACERPELFKGAIVVSALMWGYHQENCPSQADAPLDFLIIHGSNDYFYTPDTHLFSTIFNSDDPPLILGVEDTLSFWASRNGCANQPDFESENVTQFTRCDKDTVVALYNVLGGGHTWARVGDYQLNQVGVDASQLIGRFIADHEDWSLPQTAAFEGQPRSYVVYVPSTYDPDQPTPLVVGLHGRYGNGASHASLTDTNIAAEEHGFIALYPDGLSYGPPGDYGWNYTRGVGPYPEQGVDDVAFILSLIDDMALDLNIDRQRIYVDGLSNGGFMVHRLACDVPSVFAGFASVAGSGFEGLEAVCADSEHAPVPMLIIHGTADNNVLWDGRSQNIGGRQFYGSIPIIRMLGFWAQYNSCSNEIDTQTLPQQGQSPETEVRIVNVLGCDAGSAVTLYAVVGGGHNWPGTPGRMSSAVAGLVNEDIHATDVIWEFFSQFTRETSSKPGA